MAHHVNKGGVMKSIVAAFLWDGSNSKSISYMVIDDNFTIRCDPEIKAHDTTSKKTFE